MKRLFLICMLLHAAIFISAQRNRTRNAETTNAIEYKEFDYINDASVTYKNRVKIDSRLGIKIKNVNKKLVDINSEVQKSDFNSEMPKLFEMFTNTKAPGSEDAGSGYSTSDFVLFEEPALTALSPALREKLLQLHKNYDELGQGIVERENLLNQLGERYRHLKYVLQYHAELADIRNACNITFASVEADVIAHTKRTFTHDRMALNTADKAKLLAGSNYRQDRAIINSYVSAEIDEINRILREMKRQFAPGKMEYLASLLKTIKTGLKGVETDLAKIKGKSKDKDFTGTIIKSQVELKGEKELLDVNARFEAIDISRIEKLVEEFESTGKKDLFALYDQFNESNYTYYISPELIDKDQNVITVSIKPKEDVPCAPLARFYELRIRPRKGLKIDFSSGLFMNFGGNNFLDQSYRYDSVAGDPDKSVIVQNDGKNSIFPSIGALMHIYERNGRDCHFAGTFGVSTKDLDKINYHLGGSMIFGYNQRFIISAGATMTKATLISDKNYVGQIVDKATAPEAIATSDFNRFGFFLSFTFNLTSK